MMTTIQRQGLDAFAAGVREQYGPRLHQLVLFGSRARGDETAESDADVAVVLEDGDWRPSAELCVLADIGYEVLMSTGLYIQPTVISRSAWENPGSQFNHAFLQSVRRDAMPLRVTP